MNRFIVLLIVTLAFSAIPNFAFALGFGEVKLYSFIDEPLDAEIELLGAESFEPERILVSLASSQEFKRAALARPFLLSQLRFQVLRATNNATVLRVTTHENIRQPYLEFLIDLSWPGGRLVRGYTLLLDPAPPGTLPLLQRRPPVVSRSANNTVNKTGGNAGNKPKNHAITKSKNSKTNTFSQNMFPADHSANNQTASQQMFKSESMLKPEQMLRPQQLMTAAISNEASHQHRFEKLFDERLIDHSLQERNRDTELPMTVVSALPVDPSLGQSTGSVIMAAAKMGGMGSGHDLPGTGTSTTTAIAESSTAVANNAVASNSAVASAAVDSNAAVDSPVAVTNTAVKSSVADESGTATAKTNPSQGSELFQWVLAFIVLSILLLCLILITILFRRNKIRMNVDAVYSGENGSKFTLNPLEKNFLDDHQDHHAHHLMNFHQSISTNAPMQNEIVMKLELARNYIEVEDRENALILLKEVMHRGTEWEKQSALRLLEEAKLFFDTSTVHTSDPKKLF